MAPLRLALLGGLGLVDAQDTPIPINMRKAKALLAWLALHPDRPQPREGLATLLWGDSGDAKARHSLRQALSVLRSALPQAENLLSADAEFVVLRRAALTTDVAAFETIVAVVLR